MPSPHFGWQTEEESKAYPTVQLVQEVIVQLIQFEKVQFTKQKTPLKLVERAAPMVQLLQLE